ncbi:class I SAM-dependent methyltransferase [Spirillospora sp. CA-255316]
MGRQTTATTHLDDFPRGGSGAAWWDRLYETDRLEYLDRPETASQARRVHRGLHRVQRLGGLYRTMGRWIMAEVAHVPEPRILELGAGSGGLAQHVLSEHPTARWCLSDIDPRTVRAWQKGPLSAHPRVETAVIDATSIDAQDQSWDLAVFAFSLHHLPPSAVPAVFSEGTRVASRLLIIDGWRHPASLAVYIPTALLAGGFPLLHDAVISARKFYSVRALRELAARGGEPLSLRCAVKPPLTTVVRAQRTQADQPGRTGIEGP